MTKYEKEAQELFDKMYNEFPESYNKEQMAIDVQVAKCQALILCNSHIHTSVFQSPFATIVKFHCNNNHYQKLKEAIKAIES